jgi:N-acetylmuramoyl-L-alanine amidase
MKLPEGFRQIDVLVDGKRTDIPAMKESGQPTFVAAADIGKRLGYEVFGLGQAVDFRKMVIPPPKPLLGRRIAVSAPHRQGANQSTVNKAYYEGNVMFYTAVELANLLKDAGANVLLVRDRMDAVLTLPQRTNMIKAYNADLMIECHSDASARDSRGIHVIHQVARPADPLARLVLNELKIKTGLPENSKGTWTRTGTNPRIDWYWMLREILCHGLIIECGYHTDPKDTEFLSSPAAPKLIATGIRDAIVKNT